MIMVMDMVMDMNMGKDLELRRITMSSLYFSPGHSCIAHSTHASGKEMDGKRRPLELQLHLHSCKCNAQTPFFFYFRKTHSSGKTIHIKALFRFF